MLKLASVFETHVGHVRKANEDNHGFKMIDNDTSVFVVCDGMGGHLGGATASKIAVDCILTYLSTNSLEDCGKAIKGAFEFANDQVYAESLNNAELHGMGTTGVVVLVRDDKCYVGHVGDSRVYLQSDARLFRLTKDHSFVQELVDQGIIRDEDAESHPRKNQILRAIGIAPSIVVEVTAREIHVKKGDVFLLCTDGLNGMIGDKRINAVLNSQPSLNLKAKELIAQALEAGGKDNVTVGLIEVQYSPFEVSAFNHFNPALESRSTEIPVGPPPSWIDTWKWPILGGLALLISGLAAYVFWLKPQPVLVSRTPTKTIELGELLGIKELKELKGHVGDSITGLIALDTQWVQNHTSVEVENGKITAISPKVEPDPVPEPEPTPEPTPERTPKRTSKPSTEPELKPKSQPKSTWPKMYTVNEGETLDGIANKFKKDCPDISKEMIIKDNEASITDPDKIKTGQKIRINCPSK